MSFQAKTDYFGLAGNGLVCTSDADNATQSVVEATDEAGTVIAHEVFGETESPTNNYVVKSTVSNTTTPITLGSVHEVEGKSYVLTNFAINTSAGGIPSVTASGEEVELSASENCTYPLGEYSISPRHHALTLFDAFALSGSGCYVNSANYSASATCTKATKNGSCLAHDVTNGRIECQLNITSTNGTEPTLSCGTGWYVSGALTRTNDDSSYPVFAATLTKYLTRS